MEDNNPMQTRSPENSFRQSFSSGRRNSDMSDASLYRSGSMDMMEPSVETADRQDDIHSTTHAAAAEVTKEAAGQDVPNVNSPDIDANEAFDKAQSRALQSEAPGTTGTRDTYAHKKEAKQVRDNRSRLMQEGAKADNGNTTLASGERETGVNPYIQKQQPSDRDIDLNNLSEADEIALRLKVCIKFTLSAIVLVALAIVLDGLGFGEVGTKNSYGGEVEPQPDMDSTLMKLLCKMQCSVDTVNQDLITPLNNLTFIVAGKSSFAQELNSMYKSGLPYGLNQCTQVSGTQFTLTALPTIGASKTALTVTVDCTSADAPTAVCTYQLNWKANMHSYQPNGGTRIYGKDYVYHNRVLPFVAVKFAMLCIALILSAAALGMVAYKVDERQWTKKNIHSTRIILITSCVVCAIDCILGIVLLAVCTKADVASPVNKSQIIQLHLQGGGVAIFVFEIIFILIAAILCGLAFRVDQI